MTKLQALRDLLEKATPRPWKHEAGEIRPADDRKGYIASARVGPMGERYIHAERADMDLIAASHNAFDALLSIAEAAVALRSGYPSHDKLWAALSRLEETQ